ncbi:MAG TPA: hypothetical protein VNU19_17340 [Candidatus Acidoferrum sp.]|jgi:hypothetical protein|nr:hypothetical protein [Candidatus Acidoferrum sp.]
MDRSPKEVMAGNAQGRRIGGIGTATRIVLGLALLVLGITGGRVSVMNGQVGIGFEPLSVAVGLVGFPAAVLAWQWLRARRVSTRLEATGPAGTALNMLVLAALLLTPWYAPPLSFTGVAALVFYGASMLLAALRGYSGCEVTAISNWILGRDDQVGCLVLSPVDDLERRLKGTSAGGPSVISPPESPDAGSRRD